MTNHVERELTKQARELTADELERVSGGKPASNNSSPMFLKFTFKLVAV
ncbi:hypothetical protein SAMN05443247_10522 [Bradyrhizobium erythrophlei]|nr:hypothetical protein SAMN05443247_10522 [Bradyrhizobium erythrophlei]